MTFNEYQELALRTASKEAFERPILNAILGLSGESGECADIVKKHEFQGHELDLNKLKDEASDIMWYIALLAEGLGVTIEDIAVHNVEKLKKRYPEGFDSKISTDRYK